MSRNHDMNFWQGIVYGKPVTWTLRGGSKTRAWRLLNQRWMWNHRDTK